jgi:hypothetical protein
MLPLFRKLPETVRCGDLMLSNYVNQIDIKREEQFSALTIGLSDGTVFVTFRGTDDTIVAWKENFNMGTVDAVPAQIDAADYLQRSMAKRAGSIRVGGHSKGGNLAVYAALIVPEAVQARIGTVYNFDGPGFRRDRSETPGYLRVRPKLQTILSQHAIVGRLLHHETRCTIVKSSQPGIAAHDGFQWRRRANGSSAARIRFDEQRLRRRHAGARDSMAQQQRQSFVEELFSVFSATGALTLMDLTDNR